MKKLRLLVEFYCNFFPASIIITICCLTVFYRYGLTTIVYVFWFKAITLLIIYRYIDKYKYKELYYYLNNGLSKLWVWTLYLLFDITIFMISLILTYNLG